MKIYNFGSTNVQTTLVFGDGSTNSITLNTGAMVEAPGVYSNVTPYIDDWSHSYEAIITDAGIEVHPLLSPQAVVLSGFQLGLVAVGLLVAFWLVRRGLRPSIPVE